MNGPDWDKRYSKHYVRRDGWLPASKEYMQKTGKSAIKYFTLCDVHALDIFMLEMAGILKRDGNGKLPNVIICEGLEHKVPEISRLVKPPLEEAIIPESLEDLLTFEDDKYTRTTPIKAFERDRLKRRRLRLKERHERFKMFLPFDIINFDPCNGILEKALEVNRLYKALERFFELQKLSNQFLLFITTGVSNIHISILRTFEKQLAENLEKYPKLKQEMDKNIGATEYRKIPEPYKTSICFVKSIMIPIAKKTGWYCQHKKIIMYENRDGTKKLALVVVCTLAGSKQDESVYIDDLMGIIQGKASYHSYADSKKDKALIDDLTKIIEYREQVRKN